MKNLLRKIMLAAAIAGILSMVLMFFGKIQRVEAAVPAMTANLSLLTGGKGGEGVGGVYFGNYKQSANGSGGYNTDPIKWRVLSNSGGKLFLLSDKVLDAQPFNASSNNSITYKTSTVRSWLNGYGASDNLDKIDYSNNSNNFKGTAFSTKEYAAVATTRVTNTPTFTVSDSTSYEMVGCTDTNDKIFLLSYAEASKDEYGLVTVAGRKVATTDYGYSRGVKTQISATWVTREIVKYKSNGTLGPLNVFDGRFLHASTVNSTLLNPRPAFNLNLNSVVFASSATGGKQTGSGANALTAVGTNSNDEWKMTLLDDGSTNSAGSGHKNFASTVTKSGTTYTFNYTGATTGTNEYVSALIKNSSGDIKYYGRIKAVGSSASGTATLNTSGKLNSTDTLHVFQEQYNGDKKTDYASGVKTVRTITFESGGGDGGSMAPVYMTEGAYQLPASSFTRTGYKFAGWSVKVGSGTAQNKAVGDSVNITADTTVTARWTKNNYIVSFDKGTNGTGEMSSVTKAYQDPYTLPSSGFTADTGYEFTGWSVRVGSSGTPQNKSVGDSITVTDNTKVTAMWKLKKYSVQVSASEGGTASGAGEYDHGTDVTAQAVPDIGYRFVKWVEGGNDVSSDASYKFTATSDRELVAVFEVNPFSVPISKRLIQEGNGTLPDNMTFDFMFEQQSELGSEQYVNKDTNPTPIGIKSVTITDSDLFTGNDTYVGSTAGKKLYYGTCVDVLSDFNPQVQGTYCYLVKEINGGLANVTYTDAEYVLKIEVDANKEIVNIPTITLYKDSAGKTKTDYGTNYPRVFDEKQELIYYNTYGPDGGTTPTGIVTNILPFCIIGGVGAGGLTLYVVLNVRRKRKEIS